MWLKQMLSGKGDFPQETNEVGPQPGAAKVENARASVRHTVSAPALCRLPNGKIEAAVSNLSCHGCSLATDGEMLRTGQRVSLRLGGFEDLQAEVRWTIGSRAGVAFDTPISGPVFDHLMSLHGSRTEMKIAD